MLKMLDVCAGIGSFSLAGQRAGMKTVAHVELEDNRRELLSKHFPDSIKLKDIYDVTANDIPGTIDILAGGTPCQDLSIAGNRAGLSGARSSVWYEYLRLAKEFTPEWLVWENVPGALSSNGGRDFATILMGLDELGYHVAWRVLDAQYFGVPQRRRRIFLVGHLRDGRAAKVLFESESVPGNSNSKPTTWEKTSRRISTLSKSASGVNRPGGQGAELDFYIRPSDYQGTVFRNLAYGHYTEDKVGGSTDAVVVFRGQSGAGAGLSISNRVSPGLDKSQVPNVLENKYIRRVTPPECGRLQGFPEGWTDGYSDTQRYQMLGDSIAVPCSEWIMKRIAKHA